MIGISQINKLDLTPSEEKKDSQSTQNSSDQDCQSLCENHKKKVTFGDKLNPNMFIEIIEIDNYKKYNFVEKPKKQRSKKHADDEECGCHIY